MCRLDFAYEYFLLECSYHFTKATTTELETIPFKNVVIEKKDNKL